MSTVSETLWVTTKSQRIPRLLGLLWHTCSTRTYTSLIDNLNQHTQTAWYHQSTYKTISKKNSCARFMCSTTSVHCDLCKIYFQSTLQKGTRVVSIVTHVSSVTYVKLTSRLVNDYIFTAKGCTDIYCLMLNAYGAPKGTFS